MSDTASSTLLLSGDSHVIEPTEIWDGVLDADFWGDTPATFSQRPGGYDPKARLDEMATDGLQAEVLYPSLALRLFSLEDTTEQESCFRRYNEWIGEYCSVDPVRLVAIGLVPAYDMHTRWPRPNGAPPTGYTACRCGRPHPAISPSPAGTTSRCGRHAPRSGCP